MCLAELQKQINAQIHVVYWPINSEAPFKLDLNIVNTFFYERNKFSADELNSFVKNINPNLIYISGWMDKVYVKIGAKYKSKIPVVGGFDTQWNGNLKQQLNSLLSPFTIKKYFSHVWIAGEPQMKYAQKLGFKGNQILLGVYSADVPYYNSIYEKYCLQKAKDVPKRFIFVGRYLKFKGIFDLWNAFIKTFEHENHDWELICLGTGECWDKRIEHPKIKHVGFVQPLEMEKYMALTSVFVLPSHFEPWAVALHEFVSAGFPLLCSNKVGANAKFLVENQNGFVFESGNVNQLTSIMLQYINMSSIQLQEFSKKSFLLSKSMTPASWSHTLTSLL